MKRFVGFLLVFVFAFALMYPTKYVAAKEKTLGELKKELQSLEASLNKNTEEKKLTDEQIEETTKKIQNIESEIKTTNEEINKIVEEIKKLNTQIEEKNKEIKSIVNFVQVASGESAYMEYILGAKDFTDLIYRVAISEQMVDYNDKLIEEYDALVKQNNEKQETLKQKQQSLSQKQQELELQKAKLGEKKSELNEGELDLKERIKVSKKSIQNMKNMNCNDNETTTQCMNKNVPPVTIGGGNSGGNIVTGGYFIRPLVSAYVSSEYGWRFHPTLGYNRLHTGIDLGASGSSVPVYASASGKVGAIIYRASCGGNQVYIYHNIGGKTYTSGYMHLRSIHVSEGQTVTNQTVIGTVGGNPSIEYWDRCSTGQHLHFILATGLYFADYSSYNTFTAHTFNPRNMVSFPGTGGSFYGR